MIIIVVSECQRTSSSTSCALTSKFSRRRLCWNNYSGGSSPFLGLAVDRLHVAPRVVLGRGALELGACIGERRADSEVVQGIGRVRGAADRRCGNQPGVIQLPVLG